MEHEQAIKERSEIDHAKILDAYIALLRRHHKLRSFLDAREWVCVRIDINVSLLS